MIYKMPDESDEFRVRDGHIGKQEKELGYKKIVIAESGPGDFDARAIFRINDDNSLEIRVMSEDDGMSFVDLPGIEILEDIVGRLKQRKRSKATAAR